MIATVHLNEPTNTPIVGPAVRATTFTTKTFQAIGAFTGSVQVEASEDGGANWYLVGVAFTAPGVQTDIYPRALLRANVTAITVGTVCVYMSAVEAYGNG